MAIMQKVDPTKLTPAQERAWDAYVRAVRACKRTGILFYQVLDGVQPINGRVTAFVEGDEAERLNPGAAVVPLTYKTFYGSVTVTCSFADDKHFAVLKDGYTYDGED